jgi:hypothetical protein
MTTTGPRRAVLAAGFLLLAVLGGCQVKTEVKTGPAAGLLAATPREALVEKALGLQEDGAVLLASIVDQASLDRAKPRLAALVDAAKQCKAELQKLGPATPQEQQLITAKFAARSTAARQNLAREMTRVNSTIPGGGAVYRQVVEGLWKGL